MITISASMCVMLSKQCYKLWVPWYALYYHESYRCIMDRVRHANVITSTNDDDICMCACNVLRMLC
jgi:hypothetical protein